MIIFIAIAVDRSQHAVHERPGVLAAKLLGDLDGFVNRYFWRDFVRPQHFVNAKPEHRPVDRRNLIERPFGCVLLDQFIEVFVMLLEPHRSLFDVRLIVVGRLKLRQAPVEHVLQFSVRMELALVERLHQSRAQQVSVGHREGYFCLPTSAAPATFTTWRPRY